MHIYDDLINANACINVVDNKVYIIGVDNLVYNEYYSKDLRHSAAVILLALTYGGIVDNIEVLNRGYEVFFYKIYFKNTNVKTLNKNSLCYNDFVLNDIVEVEL